MKPFLFDIFKEIIGNLNPSTICEIGTHKGGTAVQLISEYATKTEKLFYSGYDVFDHAIENKDFNAQERNGKGGSPYSLTKSRLTELQKFYNFDYELIKGFTNETLITERSFDLVYIDGGHSYETVKHDYSMTKSSKLIIFDDLKIPGVRTFINELRSTGIYIEEVKTPSKHIWGVIRQIHIL